MHVPACNWQHGVASLRICTQAPLAPAEAQAAAEALGGAPWGVPMRLAPPPHSMPGLLHHNPGLAAALLASLADAQPQVGRLEGGSRLLHALVKP